MYTRKGLYAILLGTTIMTVVSSGVVAQTYATTYENKTNANGNAAYPANGGVARIEQGQSQTYDNVQFKNNTANGDASGVSSNASGGAIHNEGTVTMNGATDFTGNKVVQNNRPAGETGDLTQLGGAVLTAGGSQLTFNGDTTFTNNTVTSGVSNSGGSYGAAAGALAVGGTSIVSPATVNFNQGVTFTGNEATATNGSSAGGAVVVANNSTVNFKGKTDFVGNKATGTTGSFGGGLAVLDGTVNMAGNTTFTGNKAQEGGAIYNSDTVKLTGSSNELSSNTATANGGAVLNMGEMEINNATLSGNTATEVGGAIANAGRTNERPNGGVVTINNSTLSNNKAQEGAGVYNVGTAVLNNVTLSGNEATGNGGALHNRGSMFITGDTKIVGNTADLGSIAYNAENAQMVFSDVHDDIDLDYDPFTDAQLPANVSQIFDQSGDIYNAGNMRFTNSEIQLHNGINSKQRNKTGNVTLNNATIDLGGYDVAGEGVIYADTVNVNTGSEIRTHVNRDTDKYGKIVANAVTVNPTDTTLKLHYKIQDALKPGDSYIYKVLDATTVGGDFEQALTNQGIYTVEKLGNGEYKVSYPAQPVDPDNPPVNPDEPDRTLLCPGCDANETNTAEGWDIYDTPLHFMPEGSEAEEVQQELWENAVSNPSGYRDALDGLAPDVSPLIQAHATEITRRLSAIVSERFYNSMERTGYVHNGKRFYRFPRHESNLWVQGLYGKSKYDVRKGWDMDTHGIAVGFDGHISEALRMGLSYAYTKADGDSVGRETEIDSHTGMIYGEYNPNRFYANWLAMYTRSQYDETKKVFNHRVSADYDVDAVGAQIMLGRKMGPYVSGNWASGVIKPELGLRYLYTKQHGYTDSLGQKVGSADGQTLTGILGAQYTIGYTLSPSLSWYPELRAAVTYDFVEPDTKTRVNLLNGKVYEVTTENMDRFGIEVGAKVGLDINRKAEIAIEYEGLFKGDYTNHTGLANLKYKF